MSAELSIGGMFESPFPPEGAHDYLSNVRHDEEGWWGVLEGVLDTQMSTPPPGLPVALYEYHRRGNQRWLIYEAALAGSAETQVGFVDWRANATTSITNRNRSPGQFGASCFLTVGGWLYILTYQDAPTRWDGERLVPVGWQQGTPGITAAGPNEGFDHIEQAGTRISAILQYNVPGWQRGIGEQPSTDPGDADVYWRRGYARTFLNDLAQESPPSAVVWASGVNHAGTLSNDAGETSGRKVARIHGEAGPSWAVAQRLWCTRNTANLSDPTFAPLLLLEEFQHAGAFDYVDHTPDGELSLELAAEDLGPPPPGAYTGAFWQEAFWLVGSDDPTRLYHSTAKLHEQFGPGNYLQIGTGGTGKIARATPVQRTLVVFKERGIYLAKGSFADGFGAIPLSEHHGTDAPDAIVLVPGFGLCYLDTREGPSVIEGTANDDQPTGSKRIEGIRRTWRRYAAERQMAARVLYDAEYREIWWHVCEGGNLQPSLGLVYHLDTGRWSIRPRWPLGSMIRLHDVVFVGYLDADSPRLGVLSFASSTQVTGGPTVTTTLRTAWSEWPRAVRLVTVELIVEAIGRPEITLGFRVNRRATVIDETELTDRQQVFPEDDRGKWEIDLWSASEIWAEPEPARVPVDLDGATEGHSHQVIETATRQRLYGLVLLTEPDSSPVHRRERDGGALP